MKNATICLRLILAVFWFSGIAQTETTRVISFGTLLDPNDQREESRLLAEGQVRAGSAEYQGKGDQHREYFFPDANTNVPYRLYVPESWDGQEELPLVMFLHGAGADENTYIDQNGGLIKNLAEEKGFILVAPLGYEGAYGTMIRLPAVFGQQEEAETMIAGRTDAIEQTQQLSEKDVINVLEMVLAEYPVNRGSMFLTGHSMGSGGTWYIGAKYAAYWRALAPMSGPFVQEEGYAWDSLRTMPVFITEGTIGTPSLDGSRAVYAWMDENGFDVRYKEVDADHGGMVPLVLPDVYEFFEEAMAMTTGLNPPWAGFRALEDLRTFKVHQVSSQTLKITLRESNQVEEFNISFYGMQGRRVGSRKVTFLHGEAILPGLSLSTGPHFVVVEKSTPEKESGIWMPVHIHSQ